MVKDINKTTNTQQFIEKIEEDYFIGREEELSFFREFIDKNNKLSLKVLHHYGTGGVGKTYLLNAYQRIAKKEGVLFLQLDSQDFIHTPAGFAEYLLQIIEISTNHQLKSIQSYSIQNCFKVIETLAENYRVVISIDTYEQMDNLDRWFRQVFIRQLPENALVVLAGRQQLRNEWKDSAAFRLITKQIELKDFTLKQSREYLNKNNINDNQLIQALWKFTEGHPLTLSLATITQISPTIDSLSQNTSQLLLELTERWLHEVDDEEIHQLIYVASLFYSFDQTNLSAVLNKEIPLKKFNELISLSFIEPKKSGWAMHDLIRDAIQIELKHRDPDYYNSVSNRIAEYYYKRIVETRFPYDIAQFFYHLRNDFLQSVFFQDSIDNSLMRHFSIIKRKWSCLGRSILRRWVMIQLVC